MMYDISSWLYKCKPSLLQALYLSLLIISLVLLTSYWKSLNPSIEGDIDFGQCGNSFNLSCKCSGNSKSTSTI